MTEGARLSARGEHSGFDGADRHERAVERAVSILAENGAEWAVRRALLFEDKVDTTDVIVREITAEGEERSRARTAAPSGN